MYWPQAPTSAHASSLSENEPRQEPSQVRWSAANGGRQSPAWDGRTFRRLSVAATPTDRQSPALRHSVGIQSRIHPSIAVSEAHRCTRPQSRSRGLICFFGAGQLIPSLGISTVGRHSCRVDAEPIRPWSFLKHTRLQDKCLKAVRNEGDQIGVLSSGSS